VAKRLAGSIVVTKEGQLERLIEALEMNSIGSWEWDISTGAVVWSAKTYEIMGLESADTTPSYELALDHVHPEDREGYENALKTCMEVTGEYSHRNRIVRSDGTTRHVVAQGRLYRGPDNQPIRMIGTLQDVTKEQLRLDELEKGRIAAEERLRKTAEKLLWSEQLYRLAIEASPVAMMLVDTEHHVVMTNAKSEAMFGYTAAELLGKTIEDLVPIELRDAHRAERAAYMANPATRPMGRGREMHGRHKDGSLILVEIALDPIVAPGGNTVLASITDVSNRRRIEAELRRSQKLEAVGTLSSGVAHEFNNVLMGVSGCADIASSTIEPDNPALMYLNEIKKSAARGTAISQQLMGFTRTSKTVLVVLDLNTVVSDAVMLIGRLLGEEIEVSVRMAAENGRILADRGLMEQVLMNLVNNARDAMPEGGQLAIETRNVVLTEPNEHQLHPGDFVALRVTDSGTGMTEDVSQQVFNPFFTTKDVGQGTGLGLSIAYGIVQEVGGAIHLTSQPNKGTTFEILLPTTQKLPGSDSEPLVKALETTVGTILLIEDEPAVRMTASFYLKGAGYQVLEAASGAEAIECSKQHKGRIDLVLSDVMLPGMSGSETVQEIRKLRPDIDVLYMSAHDTAWLVERDRIGREVQTLQKPFGSDVLLTSVREALEKKNTASS
jgi:PAS domain S-box-containing protein